MTVTADPAAPTPLAARRRVAGAVVVVASVSLPSFLVGALTVQVGRDLDFSTTDLGLALGCCYALTAVSSPMAGRVVARIGAATALRLASAMTTLGLVAIAGVGTPLLLVAAIASTGIANALTQPASNEMLSGVLAPRLRALSFGLVQAAVPTASLVAGSALALASYGTSWRTVLLLAAAATLVAQVVVPRDVVRPTRLPEPSGRARAAPLHDSGGPALMVALVLSGCLASAAATALPSYAATTGLTAGAAPWSVACAQVAGSIASIAVRVLAPLSTSRASLQRRLHTVAVLQALGVVAMLGLATGTPAGFVLGSVAAFGFGWGWNGLHNLVVSLARPGRVARATGLSQAGVFAGGALGPVLFAVIAHDQRFGAGWLVMATLLMIAAIAALAAAHQASDTHPIPRSSEEMSP